VSAGGGSPGRGATAAPSLLLAAATGLAHLFERLGLREANIVLAFVPTVGAAGAWLGRGPAVLAATGAVLSYNFFFTEPKHTLLVHDAGHVITFAVLLGSGLFVSMLTSRMRRSSIEANARGERALATYRLSRALSAAVGVENVVRVAQRELGKATGRAVRVHVTGRDVGTAPEAGLALPIRPSVSILGHLTFDTPPADIGDPEQRRLLETYAALVALALEREQSAEEARRAAVQAEAERVRSALTSSLSHDLRTPLAVVTGAATSLAEAGEELAPVARAELVGTIVDEAGRLVRIVDDLLHLTRLAAGRPALQREWHVVEDVIGSALHRASAALAAREVVLQVPGDLPLVAVDGVLLELALINLLDNAAKHTPGDTPITLTAEVVAAHLRLTVSDRGPGVPDDLKRRVFEPFFRAPAQGARGTGLGLTICKTIAELHDGNLEVLDREGGGASFRLELPMHDDPPRLAPELDLEEDGADAGAR
jgi:two-component system sensor histidine kinase KdpD